MSTRRRWEPVRGYGNRVYEPWERLVTVLADLPSRAWTTMLGHPARSRAELMDEPRRVLVLRLDRIGDVVMSLDALGALRARLPHAHIALAVGRWSVEVARRAPVDEVVVWNAPWVGRPREGENGWSSLLGGAWAMRSRAFDLGIDLQGDPRASLLLWLAGARSRVGYVNAGGEAFLTHAVVLDETLSWPVQNVAAVRRALGDAKPDQQPNLVSAAERARAQARLADLPRPWIALHPSGGRSVKEWPADRWGETARTLVARFGGSVFLTGSGTDVGLAESILGAVGQARARNLAGRLTLAETMSVIAVSDLFLSADTGPMHLAQAVGTPSVSVFGPSDPRRYVTRCDPSRHVAIQASLWCCPCNLVRRPPAECRGALPECLERISVEKVVEAAAPFLSSARSV